MKEINSLEGNLVQMKSERKAQIVDQVLNKTKTKAKKPLKYFSTKVHPVSIYFQLLRNGASLESDFFQKSIFEFC